jgi:hypothetical protein
VKLWRMRSGSMKPTSRAMVSSGSRPSSTRGRAISASIGPARRQEGTAGPIHHPCRGRTEFGSPFYPAIACISAEILSVAKLEKVSETA